MTRDSSSVGCERGVSGSPFHPHRQSLVRGDADVGGVSTEDGDNEHEVRVNAWVNGLLDSFGRSSRVLVQHSQTKVRTEETGPHGAMSETSDGAGDGSDDGGDDGGFGALNGTINGHMNAHANGGTANTTNGHSANYPRRPPNPALPMAEVESVARSNLPPPGSGGASRSIEELVAACMSLLYTVRYCAQVGDGGGDRSTHPTVTLAPRPPPLYLRILPIIIPPF